MILNFQNVIVIRLQQTNCSKVKQKTNVESYKGKGGCFWVMLLVFVLCFHWDYEDSACVLAAYVMLQAWWGMWYCAWLTFNLHCSRVAELRENIPATHTEHFCIFKLLPMSNLETFYMLISCIFALFRWPLQLSNTQLMLIFESTKNLTQINVNLKMNIHFFILCIIIFSWLISLVAFKTILLSAFSYQP